MSTHVNRIVLFIVYFGCIFSAHAQEVDLVRLGYTKSELASEQTGMAASVDGKHVAFVFKNKTIKLFDVQAGRFIKSIAGPFTDLFDLQLTNDGKVILMEGNQVVVIDWKTEKTLAQFTTSGAITKSSYLPSANLLAAGQREGWVTIWDLNSLKEVNSFQYKKHHVSALALHPNAKSIAVGVMALIGESNPIKLFEIKSGSVIAQTKGGIYAMAVFDETGKRLVSSGVSKLGIKTEVKIFDGNSFELLQDIDSKVLLANAIMPYGGVITNEKFLAITASLSFNVYDLRSGGVTFTTKSDGFKLPGYIKLGIGNAIPFRLGNSGKFLINSLGNNINQIYDSKSNTIIGYFFCDSNDDFAIVSKDGRVDGTPAALSKVYWTTRLSGQKTSLESTLEKGFAPRLLTQIINEESGSLASFDVDQVVKKIPVVAVKSINGKTFSATAAVESTQKKSTVAVEITDNPQEVTEVRLYQNSKLIKTLPAAGTKYTFDVSLTSSFGEENFFFVSAGSKSGVDSEKAKFTITYKGATEAKPTLYLITIGINKYKNPKYNLNYAQADADAVEKSMNKSSSTIFKAIVPYTIRNDKAVKSGILAALDDVRKKSLEQDMVVFYYAGHGVMSGEGADAKEFYIVPTDVTQLYGRDDMLKEKAIAASSLKDYAQSINAQKQIFILDACQSAGALESVTERGVAEEKAIAQLARSTGTFWITSTGSNQFASEFEKLGHGIFTYSLIEGLDGKADANNDKKLTIRELSTYIENKVPELSEQLKGTAQYPSAYSFVNDFPIAVYK
jgi:WD40 repeat protein